MASLGEWDGMLFFSALELELLKTYVFAPGVECWKQS